MDSGKGLAKVCEGSVDGHVDSGRDTAWSADDGQRALDGLKTPGPTRV